MVTTLKKQNLLSTTKSLMLLVLFSLMYNSSIAQVAINEDDSNGDPAAALDIKSTTKGVIFPIMTETDRNNLKSPANGLLIFNRSGGYHNYYDGTNWLQINRAVVTPASNPTAGTGTDIGVGVGIADPDNSAILHVNSTTKGFLLPIPGNGTHPNNITGMIYYNNVANMIVYYDGTDWKQITTTSTGVAGAGGTSTAAGVLIGTGTIEASAKMELRPTENKGLLIPRMTSAQRDAIDTPYEGLTIYDTDNNDIEYYAANTWYKWDNSTNDYGQIITNPGLSCKDIYNNNPVTNGIDGTYYIDPDGAGANAAYACTCDMTTDGGGWTLVENTGPKGSNTGNTAAVGGAPISTAQGSALNKLSDSDINLIRGDYSTSIMRLERPNNPTLSAYPFYFKQNKVFVSNASSAQSIRVFAKNYADAVAGTNMFTGSGYYSGFSTWGDGGAGNEYSIIFHYGGEGFISYNNFHYQCGGSGSDSRSECNALLWVK